ncbi:MAG: molecular chaperone TorD family protein [Ramlibacter sp.]|nr:molecular chaperone TorD family protein [Ramlibacter sp.]
MMAELELDPSVAREDLCRFIAACYYEPGPEFVEEGLFDAMVTAAKRVDPELAALAAPLGEHFAAQDLETLLVDYTRLFLGPIEPLARPNGSFWLGGETRLMQDSTMAVQALYQKVGFDIDEAFHELPDHVAVELEFLYLTLFRRHEAQRAGDADGLRDLTRLQRRFLAQHLGAWIVPFTQAVKDGAQTAFYRDVAVLTERFVQMIAAGEPAAGASLQ